MGQGLPRQVAKVAERNCHLCQLGVSHSGLPVGVCGVGPHVGFEQHASRAGGRGTTAAPASRLPFLPACLSPLTHPMLASLKELSQAGLHLFNQTFSSSLFAVSCLSVPRLSAVFPPWLLDSCSPFQRYYADFLYPPELNARLSDLTLEGEQSSSSDPQTPGTLV